MDKIQKLLQLKQKRNAIILAHYYQDPDIQDIADFMGDSLALAKYAQKVDADVILFCGVVCVFVFSCLFVVCSVVCLVCCFFLLRFVCLSVLLFAP